MVTPLPSLDDEAEEVVASVAEPESDPAPDVDPVAVVAAF
jgi:hypothetical protein